MSPDLIFWFALAAKMLVTAGFVIAATLAAQHLGPLAGSLIATLPIAAAPAYVFLSLDHDPAFIARSALGSLAINPAIAVFALIYAVLGHSRPLLGSLGAALAFWILAAYAVSNVDWNWLGATIFNLAVFPIALWIARYYREAPMGQVPIRWPDIVWRGVLVAVLVAAVVVLSFLIGPFASGLMAVFPVVLTSIIVILHRRVGGPATAAVLANAISGLIGLGGAFLTLHLTAVPLGPPLAMTLALGVSILWGLNVYRLRRRGARL